MKFHIGRGRHRYARSCGLSSCPRRTLNKLPNGATDGLSIRNWPSLITNDTPGYRFPDVLHYTGLFLQSWSKRRALGCEKLLPGPAWLLLSNAGPAVRVLESADFTILISNYYTYDVNSIASNKSICTAKKLFYPVVLHPESISSVQTLRPDSLPSFNAQNNTSSSIAHSVGISVRSSVGFGFGFVPPFPKDSKYFRDPDRSRHSLSPSLPPASRRRSPRIKNAPDVISRNS